MADMAEPTTKLDEQVAKGYSAWAKSAARVEAPPPRVRSWAPGCPRATIILLGPGGGLDIGPADVRSCRMTAVQ